LKLHPTRVKSSVEPTKKIFFRYPLRMEVKTVGVVPLCYRRGHLYGLVLRKKTKLSIIKHTRTGTLQQTLLSALDKAGVALASSVELKRSVFESTSKMELFFVIIDEATWPCLKAACGFRRRATPSENRSTKSSRLNHRSYCLSAFLTSMGVDLMQKCLKIYDRIIFYNVQEFYFFFTSPLQAVAENLHCAEIVQRQRHQIVASCSQIVS